MTITNTVEKCIVTCSTLWQKSIALSSSVHLHFQHHQCCRHGCQEQRQYLIHTLKINFDLPRSRILNFPISDTLHCFCCPHWSADDSIWCNNKTSEWLNDRPSLKKCEILEDARGSAPQMMEAFTEMQKGLYQQKFIFFVRGIISASMWTTKTMK
jgi:hypothetical protein